MTAGDVSGDVHTAALARTLLARRSRLTLCMFWAGPRLQAAALRIVRGSVFRRHHQLQRDRDSSPRSILLSLLETAGAVAPVSAQTSASIAVVLCDWGAFNGRILPEMHARGISRFSIISRRAPGNAAEPPGSGHCAVREARGHALPVVGGTVARRRLPRGMGRPSLAGKYPARRKNEPRCGSALACSRTKNSSP